MFIVFRGIPQEFAGLQEAEERAVELCETTQEPWTVLSVSEDYRTLGLVARYRGVVMDTLDEDPT